tara:strand:+ start:7178 stop:8674 length:1497 start_codon:yes stop_codon:yes gene_type:complete
MRYCRIILLYAIYLQNSTIVNSFFTPKKYTNHSINNKFLSVKNNVINVKTNNNIKPIIKNNIVFNNFKTITVPIIIIWISSPILSLIDTVCIARVSSANILASLGPATAICDIGTYIFSFISIVTTNYVSHYLAKKKEYLSIYSINDSILTSIFFGVIVTCIFYSVIGEIILNVFIGNSTLHDPIFFSNAIRYIRIRVLGFIPYLISSQIQCSAIARNNIAISLKTVMLTTIINIVGDYILVIKYNMGIPGAALATVIAQICGFYKLVNYEIMYRKKCVLDIRSIKIKLNDAKIFAKKCIGPAFAMIGRSGISLLMASACSCCGNIAITSHQIIYNCFSLFSPVGEAISQTMLNILPKYSINKNVLSNEAKMFVYRMGSLSLIIGIIDACLAYCIPIFFSQYLTSSILITEQLQEATLWMCGALLIHTLACMVEAILYSLGDSKFLATIYILNMVSVGYVYELSETTLNLKKIWMVYTTSVGIRLCQFGIRYLWKKDK